MILAILDFMIAVVFGVYGIVNRGQQDNIQTLAIITIVLFCLANGICLWV